MTKQDTVDSESVVDDVASNDGEKTAAVLARVDERTKHTNEILERVIEKRIDPLEQQVKTVDNRSRRNALALSAITTAITIIGAWSLDLLSLAI